MEVVTRIVEAVYGYLAADWPILLFGAVLAVSIQVYADPDMLKKYVERKSKVPIFGAVGFGAFTPLCACGTMAVVLSMFMTALPWAPIMAFLVSSPLTSPSEFLFQGAFLGWDFAVATVIFSVVFGLGAGFVADYLNKRWRFFDGQLRIIPVGKKADMADRKAVNAGEMVMSGEGVSENEMVVFATCCTNEETADEDDCGCDVDFRIDSSGELAAEPGYFRSWADLVERFRLKAFAKGMWDIGVKKILLYFVVFIGAGEAVNMLIPQEAIQMVFSAEHGYSVPVAATIGLPLYVSGSAALPLLMKLMAAGAGKGAIMAFLITGKATGVPVIAGLSTILKPKAIGFYVLFVYVAGILSGFLFDWASFLMG